MRMSTLAILLLLLGATIASASPLDVFGFTSRGAAMGGALTGGTDDVGAIYYNVAAMTRSQTTSTFGFFYVMDDVYVRLKPRPEGIDPRGYDGRLNQRQDTDDISDNQGFSFGIIHNLWSKNLRVGVSVYLPTNAIQTQRTHFNDETEQYFSNQLSFELIGDRTRKQQVTFATAYEIVKGFSAGVGLSMFQLSHTKTFTYQPSVLEFDKISINFQNEQVHTFSLLGGLHVHLKNGINLGVVYREKVDFPLRGSNLVQVGGLAEGPNGLQQNIDVIVQYTPSQVGFGMAFDKLGDLMLAWDVTWYRWSAYTDNHHQMPTPELVDIFTPRIGMEYRWSKRFKVRAGYSFAKSPIPDTKGRYNYVDNDQHVVSFGVGYNSTFKKRPFSVDWHIQAHILRQRTVVKSLDNENPVIDEDPATPGLQTGNPGYPGWTSGGNYLSAGVSLTFRNVFLEDKPKNNGANGTRGS